MILQVKIVRPELGLGGWVIGNCPWNTGRGDIGLKWLRVGAILDDPALSLFQTSFTISNSCAFSLGQSHSVLRFLPRAAGGLTFQQYLQYRPANFRHYISGIAEEWHPCQSHYNEASSRRHCSMMKPVFIGCLLRSGQGTESVGINSLSLEASRESPLQRQWPSGFWSRLSSR